MDMDAYLENEQRKEAQNEMEKMKQQALEYLKQNQNDAATVT